MTLELRNEPQQARSTATLNRLTAAARAVADEVGQDHLTTADVAVRAVDGPESACPVCTEPVPDSEQTAL